MQRSTSRILTTHTGSIPRQGDLVAMLNAKELGEPYDKAAFATRVKRAIDEVVRQQVDTGIDVIGDGEHSKFNWMAYARARLEGLAEIDSPVRFRGATRDSVEFAAYLFYRYAADHPVILADPHLVDPRSRDDRALDSWGEVRSAAAMAAMAAKFRDRFGFRVFQRFVFRNGGHGVARLTDAGHNVVMA